MLWVNRITGATLIVLCAILWRVSGDYPEMAGLFPRVMFAATALLSLVMIVRSFIPAIAPGGEGEGEKAHLTLVRPLGVFGLVTVATIGSGLIGFFPAMAVLAAVLVPVLGVRQRWGYAFASVVLLAAVYVIFVIFLNVPLTWRPPGL